jgi:hypothetical protein
LIETDRDERTIVIESHVLGELFVIAMSFGLAALPIGRGPIAGRRAPVRSLLPDVREPGSMISFVALPCFLILLTLVRLGVFVQAVEPVNGPDSSRRLLQVPQDVDVALVSLVGERQLRYPPNTAELTAAAASRAEAASNPERIRGIRDLAWWTAVCPGYAPFTLPRLANGLQDPDPGVKGAAAIALGSIGNYGTPALPHLLASRGTTVSYFDHLVAEAVLLIGNTPAWPPAAECEDVSMTELESRSRRTNNALEE